jgi:prephenate dehydrogenase
MRITTRMTIGIIGGRGKTGGQFAKLFRAAGFRVLTSDQKTQSQNPKLLSTCQIIIFALPLSRATKLMQEILRGATRHDQLILDLSSLKTTQGKAMLTAPGEVIGMHPLFGPSTKPIGEHIILCPERASTQTIQSLQKLLKRLGLRVSIMSAEEHDRLMSNIQVIPHLKSLLIAEVLRSRQVDLDRAYRICTPTYQMEMNVVGRFLDDHPDLYMPIIFNNPGTKEILLELQRTIGSYLQIIEQESLPPAEARYKACQTYFGQHRKRARRESEACIQTLLQLRKNPR